MGHNRIHRFFENVDCFAELAIPSLAPEERAVSKRAAAAGKSQLVFAQERQWAQSLDALPLGANSDAATPPAKGWCNYSI